MSGSPTIIISESVNQLSVNKSAIKSVNESVSQQVSQSVS